MLGAVIGDIAGSRFEWNNCRAKDFELFTRECKVTDDSIMTLAIARAITACRGDYTALGARAVESMRALGGAYPNSGYGGMFRGWLHADDPQPYNSYGNGAAMRVSPCGFAADGLEEAILLSRQVTEVTHNHPEGLRGAEATTAAIWLARQKESMAGIRAFISRYYYPLDFALDDIRDTYAFDESCQGTVPQAITAFLESADFEDAIRNAISIGGDSDTVAAITGGIAQAYYGVPGAIRARALPYLDETLLGILTAFEAAFPV